MKKLYILSVFFLFLLPIAKAQYPSLEIGKYEEAYRDSLRRINYTRVFPILGKGAYKKGVDIPFPFGVMPAYFYQRQNYVIKDIGIAFNKNGEDNALVDISNIIKFGTIEGKTNAFTVRPDIWVFPFLNLYGLIGGGQTVTKVQLIKPDISTTQIFTGVNYGLGATLAGAVGPVFLSLDANFNWVDFKELEKPVMAQNYSIRIGHTFNYYYNPERTITVWVGPFYQQVQSNTEGDIAMNKVFPSDKVDAIKEQITEWYNALSVAEKALAEPLYNKLENSLNDLENSSIHYKLDKELENGLNFILGIQYQHNKRWQVRTEIGTFGKRSQFLLAASYRF